MKIIVNNVACKVVPERDDRPVAVIGELYEYMKYRVDGYQYSPAYQRKVWDGFTHLINKEGVFATGFLPMVISFVLEELHLQINIQDDRKNVPIFKPELDIEMPDFTLADHQIRALQCTKDSFINYGPNKLLWFPRGVWDAATNAGKTAMCACLIKSVENPCAFLFVKNIRLLKQHYKDMCKIFGKQNVGISSSQGFRLGKIITIAILTATYNRMKKNLTVRSQIANNANMLFFDESHKLVSAQGRYVAEQVDAYIRMAMSGTPFFGNKTNNLSTIGLFGKTVIKISKIELMNKGFSMKPTVIFYKNPEPPTGDNYDEAFENSILNSKKRAALIADIVNDRPQRKIVITFFERRHGRLMYNTLIEKYPDIADEVAWTHGQDPARDYKINQFAKRKIRILIVSSIYQEGINDPTINTIVYASGEKSKIPQSQYSGRGERLDKTTDLDYEYIDFYDPGKWLKKHSLRRVDFWRKEGLQPKFMYNSDIRGLPKLKNER